MRNPETSKEFNTTDLTIGTLEMLQLEADGETTVNLYPRELQGEHESYKVGQFINLNVVNSQQRYKARITKVEPGEKNSSGHDQIAVTFELENKPAG